MASVPLVSPGDLGPVPDGTDTSEPVVGVDLRGPVTPYGPLDHDRILVGVGPVRPGWEGLAAELDVTVVPAGQDAARETVAVDDPGAALAALAEAALAAPRAALVLSGLLRWSGDIPVPAALDAESFAYSMLLGGPEFRGWLAGRGERPLPPDVPEPVRLEREDDLLRVTLNRPERRNAYGRQVRDALVEALDIALLDPTVARVVLDGAGPAFCAGGDLDEFGTTPDLVTAHLVRTRGGAGRPLHALRERAEVHLHGACVGAGIELPAFAGRVVAAPDTAIRLPEIAMGLIPGAGGTVSIPRRVGRHRAFWLALSGTWLPAATARGWGLVDAIVPEA